MRFESEVDAEVHWEVSGLLLTERLDSPYRLRVALRTDDPMAEALNMLGHSVTVSVERGPVSRDFHGIVESVEDGSTEDGHSIAALEIVPALVALSHRRTSRIFQEMSVTDVLQQVLDEGLGPFERSVDMGFLTGTYAAQEYTVQFKETDLDFVHRLMEEYGISYCFRHVDGAEVLTLFDDPSVNEDLISLGNHDGVLPMVVADGGSGTREDVHDFYRESKMRSTVARTAVFDWLSPASGMQTAENNKSTDLGGQNGAALEPEREDYVHDEPSTLFGYRTAGLDFAAVEEQTRLRRVVQQRDAVRYQGLTTATGLSPGVKFELLDHPQAEFEGTYVVVGVQHSAGDFAAGMIPGEAYVNRIECIPVDLEWRPARKTRRPRIPSMQTATVVGPAGEEIHTDEYGRIQVQFYWQETPSYDADASCWIRCAQSWAGMAWGSQFIPRVGMEVVVDFLEGNPDRPLVTGCVYNAANPPPFTLPEHKTRSGWRSESSPGGAGNNDLWFEDAAGNELIYLHGEKDWKILIENDKQQQVGHDEQLRVGNDRRKAVDRDQHVEIGRDHEGKVGNDHSL
ncbi:MAG: type VI secretion system tip protein VgrG, partial [Myxococcales bacterium]|nr:type VI secretion system tip protein VgrG [Myxococcales bacterium]